MDPITSSSSYPTPSRRPTTAGGLSEPKKAGRPKKKEKTPLLPERLGYLRQLTEREFHKTTEVEHLTPDEQELLRLAWLKSLNMDLDDYFVAEIERVHWSSKLSYTRIARALGIERQSLPRRT